jgi:hypothetical protein
MSEGERTIEALRSLIDNFGKSFVECREIIHEALDTPMEMGAELSADDLREHNKALSHAMQRIEKILGSQPRKQ